MKAWTDYPITELGDTPHVEAPRMVADHNDQTSTITAPPADPDAEKPPKR